MKKILFFIAAVICSSFFMTGCSNDSKSSADITYVGIADSVCYSDSADTVWNQNIANAMIKMKVLGVPFSVSQTVTSGIAGEAVHLCDVTAAKQFENGLKPLTLAELKKTIFNENADSLIKIGYPVSDSLPIHPFSFRAALYSYYSGFYVYSAKKYVE